MANRTENKSQDCTDATVNVSTQASPVGFVKIGNPPNKSELVSQQNVFALNKRNS